MCPVCLSFKADFGMKKQVENNFVAYPRTTYYAKKLTGTMTSNEQGPKHHASTTTTKRPNLNKPRIYRRNFNVSDSSTSDSNLDRRKANSFYQHHQQFEQANEPPAPPSEETQSNAHQTQDKPSSRSSSIDETGVHSPSHDLVQPQPNPHAYYYPAAVYPPPLPYSFAHVNPNAVPFQAPFVSVYSNPVGLAPVYPSQTPTTSTNDKVTLEYPRTDQPAYPFIHQQMDARQFVAHESQPTAPNNPFYPYCTYAIPGQQTLPFQPYYSVPVPLPAPQAQAGSISQSQLQQLVLQLQRLPQSSVLSNEELNLAAIVQASSDRARKKSCYNCGSMQHDASECKEPTIDATLQTCKSIC